MDLFAGIAQSYAQFFSWEALHAVLVNPASWGIIASLVLLEGILSADNAMVLAVAVRHLPPEQRKKALVYGIWGAYLFRFLAIGIGVYLVKFAFVKILGALYLLWLAGKYFFKRDNGDEEVKEVHGGFWRTVLTVEMLDIAFSIDSVLAAFGVSGQIWVLFIGGLLGILMMRLVAQVFINLLDKYPHLEATAYVLIAFIGGKMMASAFGIHITEVMTLTIMATIFVGGFLFEKFKGSAKSADAKPTDQGHVK
ncbi:TerC family protein [Peptococcaceae bacterium 1198_IL3148]